MSNQTYVLVKQVHFGNLKTSFPIGTIFEYIEDGGKRFVLINGDKHDISRDIDIAIREGFIIPYVKGKTRVDATIKTMPSMKEKKKLRIDKSDMDQMREVIDISYTKNDVRQAAREADRARKSSESADKSDDKKFVRGLEVIKNDPLRETSISLKSSDTKIVKSSMGVKKPIQIDNDRQVLSILNEADGKHGTLDSLSVKRGDDNAARMAEKRAADRKAQIEQLRAKADPQGTKEGDTAESKTEREKAVKAPKTKRASKPRTTKKAKTVNAVVETSAGDVKTERLVE